MTNEESERIKSMTQDELEDLALKLTEENEKLRIKVNNVSKNSYDITNYETAIGLMKELRKAAKECGRFANYYSGGNGSLPSGKFLQKFVNIY